MERANVGLKAKKSLYNRQKAYKIGDSPPGDFGLETPCLQFPGQQLPLFSLDLDTVPFDCATDAAFLLQRLGQQLEFGRRQWQPLYDGDRFAAPSAGFPVQTHNAIAGSRRASIAADAGGHGSLALGAQAAALSGVNQGRIGALALGHWYSRRLSLTREYISLRPAIKLCGWSASRSMENKQLQAQLEDLQTQMAFQDDTVQALQQALASQQQELLLLRRQLELIKQRQDEQASALEEMPAPGSEQPPHY